MTDDLLVFGKTSARSSLRFSKRLEERGPTLNLDKCQLYQKEVIFYGMRFSEEGIASTEDRVRTIKDTKAATDAKILHTASYASSFMEREVH